MTFPSKLLSEDEDVVLEAQPHWLFVAGPLTAAVAVVLVTVFLLVRFDVPKLAVLALLAAIAVVLAWFAGRYVRWTATSLVLTNHRVIYRTGILARSSRQIPLRRVTDCAIRQSVAERLVGAGRVLIESGGEGGREQFPQVAHPGEVAGALQRQINMSRAHAPVPAPLLAEGLSPVALSIPDQIEKLAELWRRGIISDEEFRTKKSELLDRI